MQNNPRLFFQQVSANLSTFSMVETDATTVTLQELLPNTQYATYATAVVLKNNTKVKDIDDSKFYSIVNFLD